MPPRSAIPSMPVEEVASAAAFYRDRFGFEVRHQDEGIAVLVAGPVELHLWAASDRGWSTRTEADWRAPVRSGAESFLAGTASCRIETDDVDGLYPRLAEAGVLHPTDTGAPVDTDFGTREFHTLDLAGNLITFFTRV